MPYGLILLVGALVLAFRYIATKGTSARSKYLVGATVLASLVVPWCFPRSHLASALLQLGVGVYVLIYMKAASNVP
jgi:hypothetical protein